MQASGSLEPSLSRARELLGVAAHADAAQLARAYRRQARRLHPDISVEPNATEQFWTLRAAYQVALDAVQRDAPQTPAPVVRHVPTVVLGAPLSAVPATPWPGRGGVAWLVAGPIHVQPPERPNPGPTPISSEEGP
jgi:hypothetical protein